ncbi:hypothetical protein I316_07827 [Kwoniella heveanensis BCC8398]|uniref:Uncharacterized protein n=1 Tax=Kwoniella heveanensis BCC8398 TaxID=1296120 RepID=A0A1B9GHM8_9TREE|nr:hypothetical protein I316_07827 [Kwoniella heveanensis BCC8398]
MSRPTTTSTNLSRSLSSPTESSFLNNVYLSTSTPDISLSDHYLRSDLRVSAGPSSHLREQTEGVSDTELLRQLSHSDGDDGEYQDLDSTEVRIRGGTKPLRVRKKKGTAVAVRVAQSKPRRRRSTLSFPHSPSPRTPVSPRPPAPRRYPSTTSAKSLKTATSTSALTPASSSLTSPHPHATISRLFLSLPQEQDSLSPTIPHFISHSHSHLPTSNDKGKETMKRQYERFSGSSLHLGLGRFGSYDPVAPGPSPPTSPAPSPTKRAFMIAAAQYAKKPLPNPPSPLTPSRAPRKAAQLLGAGYTAINIPGAGKKKFGGPGVGGSSALNGKHFRPLPNAALTEIERFFGDIPKKPSSRPSTSRSRSKSTSASAKTLAGTGGSKDLQSQMNDRGAGDRNVGEGETVKYRAEDGSMWLDVEEEQEFAWLMSEIFALVPQPLPSPSIVVSHQDDAEDVTVLYESSEGEGEEVRWGMANFTSVLSLPKPKTRYPRQPKQNRSQPHSNSSNGKSGKGIGRAAKGSDNSFLDLHTPLPAATRTKSSRGPLTRPFNVSASFESGETPQNHPWTLRHTRSHSSPTPTSPKLSISPPMPALLPPPRISSKRDGSGGYLTGSSSGSVPSSGSESDLASTLSSSPPRTKIKNRPPPLTLPKIKPSSKLPILTATSPNAKGQGGQGMTRSLTSPPTSSVSQSQRAAAHPRLVPQSVPMRREISNPPYDVQPLPQTHEAPSTPFVRPRAAPKPTAQDLAGLPSMPKVMPIPVPVYQIQHEISEPQSFSEPITPTEVSSGNRKPATQTLMRGGQQVTGTGSGTGAGSGGAKKGWLKRVVRPLAGRV